MDADYSVELGPEAPALEIPWQDPEGRLHYVDLRACQQKLDPGQTARDTERNPGRNTKANTESNIERIPEAQQFPALRRFLVDLNSAQSAWQTAKCDVWTAEVEASENLYAATSSQSCYVDFVLAGHAAALRESLELHQRLAKEVAQRLETNEELEATAEIVVRRCYFHLGTGDVEQDKSEAGYCLTLFLTGFGASATEAAGRWDRAMDFAASCWLALAPEYTG